MMHEPYRDRYKDLVRTQENKRVYIDHKAVTESFSRVFFFILILLYHRPFFPYYTITTDYILLLTRVYDYCNVLTHYYIIIQVPIHNIIICNSIAPTAVGYILLHMQLL